MSVILRTVFVFVLMLTSLAGCIAVLPVTEYIPTTTGGVVRTSNCLGMHSVRYDFDGVPMSVSVRSGDAGGGSSDSPQLALSLSLMEGQIVRFTTAEIRIKPLDGRLEENRAMPAWERIVSRRVKPTSKRYERVAVETVPAAESLIGGNPNDVDDVMPRRADKMFSMNIPLGTPAATGYRVTLPTIEINGKQHTIAPIDYQKQRRLELMAPINC